MDPLADCLTALNFWNVIGGPENEIAAKRAVSRYLNTVSSEFDAQRDALDKLAAAWVQTMQPNDPVTVTEYLLHLIQASTAREAAS